MPTVELVRETRAVCKSRHSKLISELEINIPNLKFIYQPLLAEGLYNNGSGYGYASHDMTWLE